MTKKFKLFFQGLLLIFICVNSPNVSAQTSYTISFDYLNLESTAVPYSTFGGKYVVLDLFAEWCAPCKTQMAHLQDTYDVTSKNSDVKVFSLDASPDTDNLQTVINYKAKYDAKWEFGLDVNATFRDVYTISGYPTTMILSPEGKALKRWEGLTDSKTILTELDKYVKLDGRLGRALNLGDLLENLLNSPAFYIFLIMLWVFIYLAGMRFIRNRKIAVNKNPADQFPEYKDNEPKS